MKKVLVVYYTQSGQLLEIVKNVTKDLDSSEEVELSFYNIKLKEGFSFPWKKLDFYNVFPEAFLQIPSELINTNDKLLHQKYDLVVLAYQVWYLTPSVPTNSFLKSDVAKTLLNNTPVITVIGCRNMWIMAQEKVKKLLNENNANLVGNIVLFDRAINHISVITIAQWMFSGEKKKYLGVFPKPGVDQKDINNSIRFSKTILQAILADKFDDLQENLVKQKAVEINPFLITVDKRANVLFGKWANLIIKKGDKNNHKRHFWVKFFSFYLQFAIWAIAPLVFIVYLLTYPLFYKSKNKDIKYYSSVNTKITK